MKNGYQQYKEQSVMTMTSQELLIVLYDELLKRLKRAEVSLMNEDYTMFEASVQRMVEIIHYLKDTLDRSVPISAELDRFYEFFLFELSRLKAGRRKETIAELEPLFRDLRGAFAQASKG